MEIVTIRVPLPDRYLSPNARVHWAKKAKAAKRAKEEGFFEAKLAGVTERTHSWTSATMQAIFTHAVRRVRDADNHLAMLKNVIDGVTAAGLMVNDSGISPLPVKFEVGPDEGVTLIFARTA